MLIVKKSRIHPRNSDGTWTVMYSVWEPTDGPAGRHRTITTIDGKWYGRVGTAELPAELDGIQVGGQRLAGIRAWYAAQYEEAYETIRAVYPDLVGQERNGEIETREAGSTVDELTAVEL